MLSYRFGSVNDFHFVSSFHLVKQAWNGKGGTVCGTFKIIVWIEKWRFTYLNIPRMLIISSYNFNVTVVYFLSIHVLG